MTVPGMKKIFSAVAMTAVVATLTLASADVLASGKGNNNGNNGKGNSQAAASQSMSGNGKAVGHKIHNGKGHDHNHPGFINGVGHQKYHVDEQEPETYVPAGCFLAAAKTPESLPFSALPEGSDSTRYGYVINTAPTLSLNADAVTESGLALGKFIFIVNDAGYTTDVVLYTTAPYTNYEARAVNFYQGAFETYIPGTKFSEKWSGNDSYFEETHSHDSTVYTMTQDVNGQDVTVTEIVAEALICQPGTDISGPPA